MSEIVTPGSSAAMWRLSRLSHAFDVCVQRHLLSLFALECALQQMFVALLIFQLYQFKGCSHVAFQIVAV